MTGQHSPTRPWLAVIAVCSFWASLAQAVSGQEPLKLIEDARGYKYGEAIPVTCLNRTIETGEHIVDASGHLQYIPFPTCNETGRPLELFFGVEKEINCTLAFLDDALYHLLEFYIHSDAPLTCRIPSKPLPPSVLEHEYLVSTTSPALDEGALGAQSTLYTPLVIALTGTLQLSHLHVASALNLLVHAASSSSSPATSKKKKKRSGGGGGAVAAASAYSTSPHAATTRVTVGDPLPLSFAVRWYPSTALPPGWTASGYGYGGHVYTSTVLYCLLSAGASAAVCIAWFRGVDLPRRVRRYARDVLGRAGGGGGRVMGTGLGRNVGGGYGGLPVANGRSGGGPGGYGGYGYGYGGSGAVGMGKKD